MNPREKEWQRDKGKQEAHCPVLATTSIIKVYTIHEAHDED
jgi:hypothetical protein